MQRLRVGHRGVFKEQVKPGSISEAVFPLKSKTYTDSADANLMQRFMQNRRFSMLREFIRSRSTSVHSKKLTLLASMTSDPSEIVGGPMEKEFEAPQVTAGRGNETMMAPQQVPETRGGPWSGVAAPTPPLHNYLHLG